MQFFAVVGDYLDREHPTVDHDRLFVPPVRFRARKDADVLAPFSSHSQTVSQPVRAWSRSVSSLATARAGYSSATTVHACGFGDAPWLWHGK
ncbi:hypothetical protein BX265_7516 [Streptomyces sp. TLI_235]|nr:hypothetical protein BX265_7516 [Streptomyces sp. TLI_235]